MDGDRQPVPVLDYSTQPPLPPPWQRLMMRWRWLLLGLYVLTVGGVAALFACQSHVKWLEFTLAVASFFGTQALFLLGAPRERWKRPRRGRSIYLSVAAGALIAAALTAGLVASLLSLGEVAGATSRDFSDIVNDAEWSALFAVIFSWAVWCGVFGIMLSRERSGGFRRMYQVLVAGSWLELAITIPIDAEVRKRTHCYCGEGTFFALGVGLTVILWTFGPGIALLFLARRSQRHEQHTSQPKKSRVITLG